jgi:hypothetical protein
MDKAIYRQCTMECGVCPPPPQMIMIRNLNKSNSGNVRYTKNDSIVVIICFLHFLVLGGHTCHMLAINLTGLQVEGLGVYVGHVGSSFCPSFPTFAQGLSQLKLQTCIVTIGGTPCKNQTCIPASEGSQHVGDQARG